MRSWQDIKRQKQRDVRITFSATRSLCRSASTRICARDISSLSPLGDWRGGKKEGEENIVRIIYTMCLRFIDTERGLMR